MLINPTTSSPIGAKEKYLCGRRRTAESRPKGFTRLDAPDLFLEPDWQHTLGTGLLLRHEKCNRVLKVEGRHRGGGELPVGGF